ncbi:MAG TPA: hypothetical protein VM900_06135, partial [Sphingomonas sp.]|nr:hypothetical protein [Sphingomonas sp.]
ATLWHLRAALNVAALACRGPEQVPIVAGYNALLTREKATLADAERRYAAEYRDTAAPDWRDRYDDTQTRLYNFFAQAEARDGFCRAAADTLARPDASSEPATALALLEKPFTDFYGAYDVWRQQPTRAIIAVAAVAPQPVAPQPVAPQPAAPQQVAQPLPRIRVVLEGLSDTIVTGGNRR